MIKRSSGVKGIAVNGHNDRLILTPNGDRTYNVFVGEAQKLDVKVYNMAGSCVFSETFGGCEADVNLSHLEGGIYVITANGHNKKIVL